MHLASSLRLIRTYRVSGFAEYFTVLSVLSLVSSAEEGRVASQTGNS